MQFKLFHFSVIALNINAALNDIVWKGFKDPQPVEEDPETQQAVLQDKDIAPQLETFNPYSVHTDSIESQAIIAIYEQLKQTNTVHPAIKRSYKHITLPEALIYIFILTYPNHNLSTIKLVPDPVVTTPKKICLNLILQDKSLTTICQYKIEFNYQLRQAIIFENKKQIGQVTYIIRGQKCEEIQGRFKHKQLLLDPVWHAQKKGELKEERFNYGSFQTMLIYQANKKHSTLQSLIHTPTLKMSYKPTKKDKLRRVVTKAIQCQKTLLRAQLIFHKHVLIPIAGQWTIKLNET